MIYFMRRFTLSFLNTRAPGFINCRNAQESPAIPAVLKGPRPAVESLRVSPGWVDTEATVAFVERLANLVALLLSLRVAAPSAERDMSSTATISTA
jgi:hypothetical protein